MFQLYHIHTEQIEKHQQYTFMIEDKVIHQNKYKSRSNINQYALRGYSGSDLSENLKTYFCKFDVFRSRHLQN